MTYPDAHLIAVSLDSIAFTLRFALWATCILYGLALLIGLLGGGKQ